MGGVLSKDVEPMLVMEYMEHGSLYDLLHNETFVLEGDVVLTILRDISQGLRFLHVAEPQVIHGGMYCFSRSMVLRWNFQSKKNRLTLSFCCLN